MIAKNNFFTEEELQDIGFKSVGTNVKISKKTSIYKPELMQIGDNVRIEDYCIINGNVSIGNNVMICVFCLLDGYAGITIEDNVTFAAKVNANASAQSGLASPLFFISCFFSNNI